MDTWESLSFTDNPSILEKMRNRGTCTAPEGEGPDPMDLCGKPATSEVILNFPGSIMRWVSCDFHIEELKEDHAMLLSTTMNSSEDISYVITPLANAPKKCSCPLNMIMISGCKCGGT